MQSLLPDLRHAARELRKRPSSVLTAVLSLALGIGATSGVFSVIYPVLIDPFPIPVPIESWSFPCWTQSATTGSRA
jgi:hypothetical protein